MGRKNDNLFDDLFKLMVMLPWWVGLGVAVGFLIAGEVVTGNMSKPELAPIFTSTPEVKPYKDVKFIKPSWIK